MAVSGPASGGSFGLPEDEVSAAAQAYCAVENLAAADAVAGLDGTVLLEPLSGLPGYPLRTVGPRTHSGHTAGAVLLPKTQDPHRAAEAGAAQRRPLHP